jgi:hypothetical protein
MTEPIRKTNTKTLVSQRQPIESTGSFGSRIIDDTETHTGPYRHLTAIGGDVVIDSIESDVIANVSALNGDTIPEGETWTGPFKNVTFTSGKAFAYA